jgi:GDP-mannose 6-dehydrogenase
MRISIFGLGYVGTVTAACLAARGHTIVGVDVAPAKVETINSSRSPIVEPEVEALIADAVAAGRLTATEECAAAVAATDMALICVGTPSSERGSLDTQYVERVAAEIGAALAACDKRGFLVVVRSTVLPGTTLRQIAPCLERASGRAAGAGYDLLYHPEFLREGSSVRDFHQPAAIVVGQERPGAAETLLALYEGIDAPRFVTGVETAELVKYASNAFHAVKITFANEIGQLCAATGVDSQQLMRIFCADTRLNISPAYLRPGFAFGGSCLPKDLRALTYFARHHDVQLPLLESALQSNQLQIEAVLRRIETHQPRRIGMVGLAFKPHTDDLRESPLVILAERLLGRGYELQIFDPQVEAARLVGKNQAYVQRHMPHLSRLLLPDLGDMASCDLIVVGHTPPDESWTARWLADGKRVLDLTGGADGSHPGYEGLYW